MNKERAAADSTPQAIWNANYERVLDGDAPRQRDPWLEKRLPLIPMRYPRRAFDVGCGLGNNTRWLLDQGFEVTAIDVSDRALEFCRETCPNARVQWADLRDGLPFQGENFELVVAELSLHYFTWETTTSLVEAVAARLVPNGVFAARFNSVNDVNYGAADSEPVPGEPNLLERGGTMKRFFSEEHVRELLPSTRWRIISLEEKTSAKYGAPKTFWETVCVKF